MWRKETAAIRHFVPRNRFRHHILLEEERNYKDIISGASHPKWCRWSVRQGWRTDSPDNQPLRMSRPA